MQSVTPKAKKTKGLITDTASLTQRESYQYLTMTAKTNCIAITELVKGALS